MMCNSGMIETLMIARRLTTPLNVSMNGKLVSVLTLTLSVSLAPVDLKQPSTSSSTDCRVSAMLNAARPTLVLLLVNRTPISLLRLLVLTAAVEFSSSPVSWLVCKHSTRPPTSLSESCSKFASLTDFIISATHATFHFSRCSRPRRTV